MGTRGVLVSELCLGTMTFGDESDEAESHKMLDLFVDSGGNFIDTPDLADDRFVEVHVLHDPAPGAAAAQ